MIRVFIEHHRFGNMILLNPNEKHYLKNVMRKQKGSIIHVFNSSDGEWEGKLIDIHIVLIQKIKDTLANTIKSIAVGCIKKNRMEYLVEKATEVGIDNIFLLNTEYSQPFRYDMHRLERISIEAAEQSGRISIPTVHEPQPIESFLNLNFSFASAYQYADSSQVDANCDCILIGPEGGWSKAEIELMSNIDKIKLGENILRTETAAVIAAHMLTCLGCRTASAA